MTPNLSPEHIIALLPHLLKGRLENDGYFCDIPVVVAEMGNIQATIEQRQAVITQKTGRRGVAAVVLQLEAEDVLPEQALGPLLLKPSFQIIEQVALNNDDQGTKKSARAVARRIVDLIKTFAIPGVVTDFVADNPCIHPVTPGAELGSNVVLYQVNFKTFECEHDCEDVTNMPEIDMTSDGGHVALSCVDVLARIYFTSDESFPGPENPSAALYADPVPVPEAGMLLMAAAYAPGKIGSYVNRALVKTND